MCDNGRPRQIPCYSLSSISDGLTLPPAPMMMPKCSLETNEAHAQWSTPEIGPMCDHGQPAACLLPDPALPLLKKSRLESRPSVRHLTKCAHGVHKGQIVKSDSGIRGVLNGSVQLERLRIDMGDKVTGAGIQMLTRSTSLQHLELRWDPNAKVPCGVDAEAVGALASLPLVSVLLECCVNIDLTAAILAFAQCPTLRRLSFLECLADSEECMAALARCHSLRHLQWCAHATDVAVWELLAQRGGRCLLEELSLSAYGETELTDDAVLTIADCCPELVSLSLADIAGVSDQATLALAGRIDGVEGCPKLKWLDLGYSADRRKGNGKSVDPTCSPPCGNRAISDASLSVLAEGALPALEILDVRGCLQLSYGTLVSVVQSRPRLCVVRSNEKPQHEQLQHGYASEG